jgi:hypothetical protein
LKRLGWVRHKLREDAMTLHAALRSLAVLLFAVPTISAAEQGAPPRSAPRDNASEAEIVQAFAAIEAANGYPDIVNAVQEHEAVIASARMVALANARLQDGSLDRDQRGVVLLMRQLSMDCRDKGARPAARLLAVRLVAGYALASDTPQQFATILEQFSPLEAEMSAEVVREALDAPGNTWPSGLLPLMQQLAHDWRQNGALAAATAMASSANGGTSGGSGSVERRADQPLVGHWQFTRIEFGSPRDENLVLRADGTAEHWFATASGRSEVSTGRWTASGSTFNVKWADGEEWSQPFTFFEGQFVFPNIQGRRKIWERIQ